MRITKHEAAVLADAMEDYKYACASKYSQTGKLIYSKLESLQQKLEANSDDRRLYSPIGKAKMYPDLYKIITKKLK